MRKLFSALLLSLPLTLAAQGIVNLTPVPNIMVAKGGSYTLPTSFTVGGQHLPDSIAVEGRKFVEHFNRSATGATASNSTGATLATVQLVHTPSALGTLGAEGYRLSVDAQGITATSATARGMYYALTSLRKMLPADIGAGVKDGQSKSYTLPLVSITDKPRFRYRGFMLDVSRHFFTADEVKRMIDIMALYKMNTFHFHLTDDQGWRWEVKRYPRLTQVGSIASNSYLTAYKLGPYHTNAQYGPYFYTQEQLRDIVAYAAERHIEVVPEIDMPGHITSAMVAYPEYSCRPNIHREVRTTGGIFNDVLNVGNPEAVQFAKNVLDELMDIFPSKTIHIGGDECPDAWWRSNEQCQARYNALRLTHYRQLQSHFIKEIDEHVKSKGRKLALWNESISAEGADTKLIQKTDATIFCWTNPRRAAQTANSLKLNHIYTPWGPYYINRRSSDDAWEHTLPGKGGDHLRATYKEVPPNTQHLIGLQGTFWTEHVGTAELMEYLALPRLMAIAEVAWTPTQKHDFESFRKRMNLDTKLLDLGGYTYGRNFLDPAPAEPAPKVQHPTTFPVKGKTYMLRCNVEGFQHTALVDANAGADLTHSTDTRAPRAWIVTEMQDYDKAKRSLKVKLQNAQTQRYIANSQAVRVGTLGFPVQLNAYSAQWLTLTFDPKHEDYVVRTANDYALFPIPSTSTSRPNIVSSGSTYEKKEGDRNNQRVVKTDAVRPQGAAWTLVQVRKVNYVCTDEQGKSLGNVVEYLPIDQTALTLPTFRGYTLQSSQPSLTAGESDARFELKYRRTSYQLALTCQDPEGGLLRRDTLNVPPGEPYTLTPPTIDYYTTEAQPETLQLQADAQRTLIYTTDAYPGVLRVAEALTALPEKMSVLLYDMSEKDINRAGYRSIAPSDGLVLQSQLHSTGASPYFTWTLEKVGQRYQFKNHATSLFMPEMVKSGDIKVSRSAGHFLLMRNGQSDNWRVQGSNGLYWDGREGSMTGWHQYGHAYRLHRYFVAPYYRVQLTCEDENGKLLQAVHTTFVPAGAGYTLVVPTFKGLPLKSMSHTAQQLASVKGNIDLRLVYARPTALDAAPTATPRAAGIYDLSGRRVQSTGPGVYVVEGKKAVLR